MKLSFAPGIQSENKGFLGSGGGLLSDGHGDPCLRPQGPYAEGHSGQGSVSQALPPPPLPSPSSRVQLLQLAPSPAVAAGSLGNQGFE